MFKRSGAAEVTPKSPSFSVRYLGKREAPIVRGQGCTQELMKTMWDDVVSERQLPKLRLTIHRKSLDLAWVGSTEREPQRIPMQAVTYCSLDRAVNNRIFSWIHATDEPPTPPGQTRGGGGAAARGSQKHWCVAVVASSTDKARAMSVVLQRSFLTFYKDSVAAAAKPATQTAAAVEAALSKRREASGGGSGDFGERLVDAYGKSGGGGPDDDDDDAWEAARTRAVVTETAGYEQGGLYADVEIAYDGGFATASFGDAGTNAYYGFPSAPPSDEAGADEFSASTLPIRQPPSVEDRTDVPRTSL